MPRVKHQSSDIQELLQMFQQNKHEIINDGKIASRRSSLWSDLSNKLENKFSGLALFTVAAKNYYNSHTILGIQDLRGNISDQSPLSSSDESMKSECSLKKNNTLKFTICLTFGEYQNMNRHTEEYRRQDSHELKVSKRKSSKRMYDVFEQRHWSHLLCRKIEGELSQLGSECAIIFKNSKIYSDGLDKFATFLGECKECKAKLLGSIDSPPRQNEDVLIVFELKNFVRHGETNFKRPLSGRTRKEVSEKLIERRAAPSYYRKLLASENSASGLKGSWIPNLNTLRVAKYETEKLRRSHDDPIQAICLMKVDPSMKGSVQNIGLDPFFVYFWTNTQLHVYNTYCKTEYSRLSIDATGSVVRKLKKVTGEKTRHIFLYDCAVLSKRTTRDNQYSVSNMLSESQNAVSIYSWLAHWIRSGASVPNEVVTDMSLALIYAVILAFTNCKTLKEYLKKCFDSVFFNKPLHERCFIRLDVAHFIKLVSGWPSLKNQHRLTKQFYLRSIGQLVQCQNIADAEAIIKAICTVALSDTEGNNTLGEPTACERMKSWLIKRISTGSIEPILDSIMKSSETDEADQNLSDIEHSEEDSPFSKWVSQKVIECKSVVNTSSEIGDRGNQQCVPVLVKDLVKSCKLLPLWSCVMFEYFPNAQIIGSSAAVESNINNIKNRLFGNIKLPIRADEFLKRYIIAADGASNLAKTAMSAYEISNPDYGPEKMTKDVDAVKSTIIHQQTQVVHVDRNDEVMKESIICCSDSDDDLESGTKVLDSAMIDQRVDRLKECRVVRDEELLRQDIYCPSCQLKQSGTEVCSNCSMEIHRNQFCSIEKDFQLFCLQCAKLEQTSIENWRGLGSHPTKRPRHSYLEPTSELLIADYSSTRPVIPIALMRNGHLTDLKPIKISADVSLTLSNTCGFDSLIQILATAFCDSDTFKKLVLLNSEQSQTMKIIAFISKHGVNKKTYRLRAMLLMSVFNTEENPCGMLSLDVATDMGSLVKKLDINYSAMQIVQCSNCSHLEAKFLNFLEATVQEDQLDVKDFTRSLENFYFQSDCKRTRCSGHLLRKTEVSPTHFFVEPLNPKSKNFQFLSSLDSIPKKIQVNACQYILRGIVGYIGPNEGIGHFIAYSFRHNDKWQMFDDRKCKSEPCSSKKEVLVQLILYTL